MPEYTKESHDLLVALAEYWASADQWGRMTQREIRSWQERPISAARAFLAREERGPVCNAHGRNGGDVDPDAPCNCSPAPAEKPEGRSAEDVMQEIFILASKWVPQKPLSPLYTEACALLRNDRERRERACRAIQAVADLDSNSTASATLYRQIAVLQGQDGTSE